VIQITMTRGKGGFSLIETLVAAAVIAVLAVVGFGVIMRSQQLAGQTACMQRLRQVNLAVLLYTQENRNRFPGPLPGNHGALYIRSGNTLAGYLAPYLHLPQPVGQERLIAEPMECTVARQIILKQGGNRENAIYYNAPTSILPEGSFRPFGYIASGVNPTPPLTLAELGGHGILSRIVLLTETDRHLSSSLSANVNAAWEIAHHKGRNVAFADGHVEFQTTQ